MHPACLQKATKAGKLDIVKWLLSILPQHPNILTSSPEEETETLLHWACECGHLEVVNLLLDHGFDVNAGNPLGNGPILRVCEDNKENMELAKLLFEKGATVEDVKLNDGDDATYHDALIATVAAKGHSNLLKLLLEKGVKISDTVDITNNATAKNINLEVVKIFMEHTNRFGNLFVDFAVSHPHAKLEIVQYLIDKGVSVSIFINYIYTLSFISVILLFLKVKETGNSFFYMHALCHSARGNVDSNIRIQIAHLLYDHGAPITLDDKCIKLYNFSKLFLLLYYFCSLIQSSY